ncbi:MAG: hypothetical protein WBD95_05815 [Xanthobacteraceae bacterium]
MSEVSQAVVAGVARIRTVNQLHAPNHVSNALRLGANEHGVYFDIFDARANTAMSRWLIQIKRGMRDGVAVLIPSGMFTNNNLMIDFAGLR